MANMTAKKGMLIDVQPLRTKKEIKDMLEALGMSKEYGMRNQLLFKIGISTGLRCSDLVKLRVDQVRGKSSLQVSENKTSKKRNVYLNQVMADIADYLETIPDDTEYLFQSRKGGPITVTQAYRIIAKAGEMIGNPSVGTHTMRKTFGYTYYQATKDIVTLMMIFNHSSQKVTTRYIGVTEENIEETIKSISFF